MALARSDTEELLGDRARNSEPAVNYGWTIGVLVAAIGLVAIGLIVLTHGHNWVLHIAGETEFGSVPSTLQVSGFACPHGANDILNGEYTLQGKTGDGRVFYAKGKHLLYYDRGCDRDNGGRDSEFGRWSFSAASRQTFHPTRKEHLLDSACDTFATLVMDEHLEEYNETQPNQGFSQRPGALPPAVHEWDIWCGNGWTVQTIHVNGGSVLVEGAWRFVKTAMPKEKITLKHGKSKTTTEGGNWEVSASTSVSLGGVVGILDFGGSVKLSKEAGGRLQHMWDTMVKSTSMRTVEFELPEQKGTALWQWVLIAKGKETGYVKTGHYAFTASGTEGDRPKRFPGGSKDGHRYQECHDGWEIP